MHKSNPLVYRILLPSTEYIVRERVQSSMYCMYQYIVMPSGMSIVLHTPYPDSIQTSERG